MYSRRIFCKSMRQDASYIPVILRLMKFDKISYLQSARRELSYYFFIYCRDNSLPKSKYDSELNYFVNSFANVLMKFDSKNGLK
jgi:hypothetical protein